MEKNEYVISFIGKGESKAFINIERVIRNAGANIIKSEFKAAADSIAGYFLIQGLPKDTSKKIEERFGSVFTQFPDLKFLVQNSKIFDYTYSI